MAFGARRAEGGAEVSKPKPELEDTVATPNGGTARRCRRIKKDGTQCGRAARVGHDLCGWHGAGYAKREREGSRNPPGRPPIHGLYSKRHKASLDELTDEVYATQGALDNSDRDLAALKAAAWLLKDRLDEFLPKLSTFDRAAELLEHVLRTHVVVKPGAEDLGRGEMTADDAREITKGLGQAQRVLQTFESLLKLLVDVQAKTIQAHHVRASTGTKLAETRAQEQFLQLVRAHRAILHELAPDTAWLDAYEERIVRELLSPNRLELPSGDPEKLN